MKFGMRKPSLKKSLKARTTGKLKRKVKKALIPGYGKKGMGILHPKKAIYNKVYNKTSFSIFDIFKRKDSSRVETTSALQEQYSIQKQHPRNPKKKTKGWLIGIATVLLLGIIGSCGKQSTSQPENDSTEITSSIVVDSSLNEEKGSSNLQNEGIEAKEGSDNKKASTQQLEESVAVEDEIAPASVQSSSSEIESSVEVVESTLIVEESSVIEIEDSSIVTEESSANMVEESSIVVEDTSVVVEDTSSVIEETPVIVEETSSIETEESAEEVDTEPQMSYVINTNKGKFHYPSCGSVNRIKDENRWDYYGTRQSVIDMGYEPCGNCHP